MIVTARTKLVRIEVKPIGPCKNSAMLKVHGPLVSGRDLSHAINVLTVVAVTKEAHVELKHSSTVDEIGFEALVVTGVCALEVIQKWEANATHAIENIVIAVLMNALAIVTAYAGEISGHTIRWA